MRIITAIRQVEHAEPCLQSGRIRVGFDEFALEGGKKLSPTGYLRMMRLERAAQLLEQEAATVSEIAYAVRFNDAEYFSKRFR